MEDWKFYEWCRKAVSAIGFPPDKNAVCRELMDHMDDHCAALMEQGHDPDTARRMTVTAMGDPYEVAPLLAALHRPFWGYFLRAVRVLLVIALTLTLIPFGLYLGGSPYSQPEYSRFDPFCDRSVTDEVGETTRLFYAQPNQSAALDGRILTLTQAAMWYTDFTAEGLEDGTSFSFRIRVIDPRSWAQPDLFLEHFWAEDSLGNTYAPEAVRATDGTPAVSGRSYQTGPFTHTLELSLNGFCSQEADWIDICYTRDGRDLRFRIRLTGGTL